MIYALLATMAVGLSVPGVRISTTPHKTIYTCDHNAFHGPEKIYLRTSKVHRFDPMVMAKVPMWYTWECSNLPEYDRCGWTGRYFCKPDEGDEVTIIYSQKAGRSIAIGAKKTNDRNGGQ